jgi:hypothetical protein
MLQILLNPSFIALAALFLSIVWMMRDEKDRTRPLLVLALVVNFFYGFLLTAVMGKENSLVPWKYDFVLANLDRVLGVTSTRLALALQGGLRLPLAIVYQVLVPMMVAWFLVARARRAPGSIVVAYVAEMVIGPILYAIVPACGPIYAFGKAWLAPPAVSPELVRFSGMPNAFPSLHVATALLFVLYSPTKRWRAIALLFLTATAAATVSTGEHYVIDLIAGLAFGCFAANVSRRQIARSIGFLALVGAWTVSVRFGYQSLLAHALVLRGFALFTLAATAAGVAWEWRDHDAASEPA